MHSFSLPSTHALWRHRGRASLKRRRLRVLVPVDGYHVQHEIVRALSALGHEAMAIDMTPPLAHPRKDTYGVECVLSRITQYAPDLIVCVNYVGLDRQGIIDDILRTLELPCAIWFVDHPLFFALGYLHQRSPHTKLFAWDLSHARALERYGASPVTYLPLACEPERFATARQKPSDDALPMTFVGSSLVPLSATWRARLTEEEAATAEAMATRLEEDRNVLHELVEAPKAPIDRRAMVAAYANCVGSRRLRRTLLEALPQRELAIFGDDAWAQELPQAHAFAPVHYGNALGEVYRRSTLNVNATILQMPCAVNQRVFDVPAAGGFIVTDAQSDAHTLFRPGEEIVTYANADELRDHCRYFAARPKERHAIAAKALARIEDEHTYVHRIQKLLSIMQQETSV